MRGDGICTGALRLRRQFLSPAANARCAALGEMHAGVLRHRRSQRLSAPSAPPAVRPRRQCGRPPSAAPCPPSAIRTLSPDSMPGVRVVSVAAGAGHSAAVRPQAEHGTCTHSTLPCQSSLPCQASAPALPSAALSCADGCPPGDQRGRPVRARMGRQRPAGLRERREGDRRGGDARGGSFPGGAPFKERALPFPTDPWAFSPP